MATIVFPPGFKYSAPRRQRPGTAQARFAVALAVSAFLHLWLARSVAVEAPKHPAPATVSTLTARLEPAAISAAAEARKEPEASPDGSSEPRVFRAKNQRPSERVALGARHDRHSAPPETAIVRATAVPALQPHTGEPTYYPARELDVYPAPLARLRFEYPERAARKQVGGRMLIMLLINETGTVDEVSVVTAEPAGYFEDAVRAVFAAARFSPARKEDRAVGSRVLISVAFDPEAAEGALR